MLDTVFKVCSMPRNFKASGNKSMIQLLNESGYGEHKNSIAQDDIMRCLVSRSDLVEDWEVYSEDKRTSAGWYLLHEESVWTVGYARSGGGREKEHKYSSGLEACAVFIINELEQLAETARYLKASA